MEEEVCALRCLDKAKPSVHESFDCSLSHMILLFKLEFSPLVGVCQYIQLQHEPLSV